MRPRGLYPEGFSDASLRGRKFFAHTWVLGARRRNLKSACARTVPRRIFGRFSSRPEILRPSLGTGSAQAELKISLRADSTPKDFRTLLFSGRKFFAHTWVPGARRRNSKSACARTVPRRFYGRFSLAAGKTSPMPGYWERASGTQNQLARGQYPEGFSDASLRGRKFFAHTWVLGARKRNSK